MSENEHDLKLISDAVDRLAEHFDTVQIFASRHEPTTENGTVHWEVGRGSWFARYGQIRTWLIQEEGWTRTRGANLRDRGES